MAEEFFRRILKKEALVEAVPFLGVERTWGKSITLDANTRIHFIHGEPSAHFHTYRTEEYILLSGKIAVYRGHLYEGEIEKTVANMKGVILQPGDKVVMPPKTVHIPINLLPDGGSTFVEISHGVYEEEDVKRVYDKDAREPALSAQWTQLGYPQGLSLRDLVPLAQSKLIIKDATWPHSEETAKVVIKPWGREIWLNYKAGEEVGEIEKKYVFKKIYVNAGTRMSFQHHEKKHEVNFLIAGKVEAWLENEKGEIEKKIVNAGSIWEIIPPKKHRMVAIEDSIIIEGSTPEVDDVVRHQDDSGRSDGRIQSEHKI